MGKTLLLRKLIKTQLQKVEGETYHRKAPKDAVYPYKTFRLSSASFVDERDDQELEVDIWDRADDPKSAEELADEIETLFHGANLPAPPIYPTFFRENRRHVDDPDKALQHIQLRFLVQLYKED